MDALRDGDWTAEEREAGRDEQRPGVWLQRGYPDRGDGRALSQTVTNWMIELELLEWSAAPNIECTPRLRDVDYLAQLPSRPQPIQIDDGCGYWIAPHQQRGGIHSDDVVRSLAYRAWGDRDRRWGAISNGTVLYADLQGNAITFPWYDDDKPIGTAVSFSPGRVQYRERLTGEFEARRLGTGMPAFLDIVRRDLGPDHQCRCYRCPFSGQLASRRRCTQDELRARGVLPTVRADGRAD